MEEKQRLAKQQEQERALKAQKTLVPKSENKPLTSATRNTSTPPVASSSGPRDLTSTLMESNMKSLRSSSPAGSSSLSGSNSLSSGGINWQSSGMSSSVNWGSASSSDTASAYTTPRSSPAAFDSPVSASSKKSNVDLSSFDSLLPSSSTTGMKTPINQMAQSPQGVRPVMMHQQPHMAMSSFGVAAGMGINNPGVGGMGVKNLGVGGMGVNNSGAGGIGANSSGPQWGNARFSSPGTFQQPQPMNMSGYPMYNNNAAMMMPPQRPMVNTAGMQGSMFPNTVQTKPLSNDDLKDLLG